MEVTITGQCPHCRREVKLHEHQPAEMPKGGEVVTVNGELCVVTACENAPAVNVVAYQLAKVRMPAK